MSQTQIPNILSLLTFLPLIGALIVMFLPRPVDLPEQHGGHDHHDHDAPGEPEHGVPVLPATDYGRMLVNGVSLFFTSLTLLLAVALFVNFQVHPTPAADLVGTARNIQFLEDYKWIAIGNSFVHYKMGVDGISLMLVLLSAFLMVLCVLFSTQVRTRLKEFMVFLLLLETAMIGVFCALDLVLFYVFFEAMLIPMYFLIGIFGHENRIYAAVKFFIYTFAGSVFMLVAIVAVYNYTGSFDILALSNHQDGPGRLLSALPSATLTLMFFAFAIAFMIKVPMFPFHTWLPDAHVEAPTAGSVILAGVMLKMGTYGFVRLCLPLFPQQAREAAPIFITLAIVGIIYASIVATIQPDAKKLVAYSSVAHLGFVVLGIFTFTRVGMMGALVQNINHGISTPMLFFIVGMLYERRHTRDIKQFGGLKKYLPHLANMLLLATLSSIAVPFFNGFVGEFPVLLGSWVSEVTQNMGGYWPTALAATGMILSAVYMLWWYQRLMLGPITNPVNKRLPDLSKIEWGVLVPLAVVVFWFGLFSNFWTQRMDDTVDTLLPVTTPNGISENIQDLPAGQRIRQIRMAENSGQRTRRKRDVVQPAGAEGHPEAAPLPGGGTPEKPASEGTPGSSGTTSTETIPLSSGGTSTAAPDGGSTTSSPTPSEPATPAGSKGASAPVETAVPAATKPETATPASGKPADTPIKP